MKLIPIAHYEERYALTKKGDIINLANNLPLKPRTNKNGYLIVTLAGGKENLKNQVSIHRLMALHFLPNPYGYKQVNHKDGIKEHNFIENLEWCSCSQNIQHAFKIGLRPGYMSGSDKEKYVKQILAGIQVKDLAESIGRHPNTLHKMCRETAKRMGLQSEWTAKMKESRKNAAIQNLRKINN